MERVLGWLSVVGYLKGWLGRRRFIVILFLMVASWVVLLGLFWLIFTLLAGGGKG